MYVLYLEIFSLECNVYHQHNAHNCKQKFSPLTAKDKLVIFNKSKTAQNVHTIKIPNIQRQS